MNATLSAGHVPSGTVYLVPHRNVGRRKSIGTSAWIDGQMTACIGYSPDGTVAVFAPVRVLKTLKAVANKVDRGLLYKFMQWLMRRYDVTR